MWASVEDGSLGKGLTAQCLQHLEEHMPSKFFNTQKKIRGKIFPIRCGNKAIHSEEQQRLALLSNFSSRLVLAEPEV